MIRLLRSVRGNAAVEFALVAPLVMALLAGIIDFGHGYWTKHVLTAACREGARVGSRYKASSVDLSLVENKVQEYIENAGVGTDGLTVSAEKEQTTGPAVINNDWMIIVRATKNFEFMLLPSFMTAFLNDPDNPDPLPSDIAISSEARMLFERI